MKRKFREIARAVLRRAGWQLHRYSPSTSFDAQLQLLLATHQVDLIIDVGANAGQYASAVRNGGYRGDILSFEPLREPRERCAHLARADPRWVVAPRSAIGAVDGQVEIQVAANSVSSSILEMNEIHRRAAPGSAYVEREIVDLRRLDTVAAGAISKARRSYLKVDTQGYEREVLTGAAGVLDRIAGLQLEMSLVPLYSGAVGFEELLQTVLSSGFTPYAFWPGFTDPESGRTLQVDGVFFRAGL